VKLKLDENIGRRGVEMLVRAGHDVATVFGQGVSGITDEGLFRLCQEEDRCLVTLDLDFANPLRFRPAESAGIAVLRLPRRLTLDDLLDGLRTFIVGLSREDIIGKLWIIQKGRIRAYQPDD
jgi:hypothetical protein